MILRGKQQPGEREERRGRSQQTRLMGAVMSSPALSRRKHGLGGDSSQQEPIQYHQPHLQLEQGHLVQEDDELLHLVHHHSLPVSNTTCSTNFTSDRCMAKYRAGDQGGRRK